MNADNAESDASPTAAEVGEAFSKWAMKNEIQEPPLDWKWFGEIVRWSGAPSYEREDES